MRLGETKSRVGCEGSNPTTITDARSVVALLDCYTAWLDEQLRAATDRTQLQTALGCKDEHVYPGATSRDIVDDMKRRVDTLSKAIRGDVIFTWRTLAFGLSLLLLGFFLYSAGYVCEGVAGYVVSGPGAVAIVLWGLERLRPWRLFRAENPYAIGRLQYHMLKCGLADAGTARSGSPLHTVASIDDPIGLIALGCWWIREVLWTTGRIYTVARKFGEPLIDATAHGRGAYSAVLRILGTRVLIVTLCAIVGYPLMKWSRTVRLEQMRAEGLLGTQIMNYSMGLVDQMEPIIRTFEEEELSGIRNTAIISDGLKGHVDDYRWGYYGGPNGASERKRLLDVIVGLVNRLGQEIAGRREVGSRCVGMCYYYDVVLYLQNTLSDLGMQSEFDARFPSHSTLLQTTAIEKQSNVETIAGARAWHFVVPFTPAEGPEGIVALGVTVPDNLVRRAITARATRGTTEVPVLLIGPKRKVLEQQNHFEIAARDADSGREENARRSMILIIMPRSGVSLAGCDINVGVTSVGRHAGTSDTVEIGGVRYVSPPGFVRPQSTAIQGQGGDGSR